MSLSPRPDMPIRIFLPGLASAQRLSTRQRMRGPESRQNALAGAALAQGIERFISGGTRVGHATDRLQQRVLWPDTRIVETSRDRVRFVYLAIGIL